MPPTIEELVKQAIVARLNTSRPAGVAVYERTRTKAIDPSGLKANLVYAGSPFPLDEEVDRPGGRDGPVSLHELIVTVEHRAKGDSVAPLDSMSDEDVAWTVSTLEGTAADGLWHDIRIVGSKRDYDQLDYGYVFHQLFLRVKFQTKTADATKWSESP